MSITLFPEIKDRQQLVSQNQLGPALGVRPDTLRCWRARKKGPPYILVGSKPRYVLADVDRWLESRRVAPEGDPA